MTRPAALAFRRPHPLRAALAPPADAARAGPGDDLRLFLTAWAGGLVFFATFLA